jgi:hypothetical protein
LGQKRFIGRKTVDPNEGKTVETGLQKYTHTVDARVPETIKQSCQLNQIKPSNPQNEGSFVFDIEKNEEPAHSSASKNPPGKNEKGQTYLTEPGKESPQIEKNFRKTADKNNILFEDARNPEDNLYNKNFNSLATSINCFRPSKTKKKVVLKGTSGWESLKELRRSRKADEDLKSQKSHEKYSKFIEKQKNFQAKKESKTRHKALITRSTPFLIKKLEKDEFHDLKIDLNPPTSEKPLKCIHQKDPKHKTTIASRKKVYFLSKYFFPLKCLDNLKKRIFFDSWRTHDK